MVEIMWHRRETRRKQRKQTSTCSIGRNRSTRLNPGAIQLESIYQLASWLIFVSKDFKVKGTLSELGNIKFKDFVKPGDQLVIEVTFESMDSEGVTFKANATVKDKVKTAMYDQLISINGLFEKAVREVLDPPIMSALRVERKNGYWSET
ncbi:MAG: hypothetical protein JRJ00_09035 [Deltaproteobacteria bacterium]|nr:hypothetical protein [Deltaproteobacteria bacterium]